MPIYIDGQTEPQPQGWETQGTVTSKPVIGMDKMSFSFRDTKEQSMNIEVRSLTHPDMYNIQQSFLNPTKKHLKLEVAEQGYKTDLLEATQTLTLRPAPKRAPGGLETTREELPPPSSTKGGSGITR